MRKITALTALLALSLAISPAHAYRTLLTTLLLSLSLLSACFDSSGSDCVPGRDIGDWTKVEVSPEATTVPVVSCGKTVGWDISMPAGEHASVMWRYEKWFGGIVGEKVRFAVELEAKTAPAYQIRTSLESAGRAEFGYADIKPGGTVRAEITDRVSPTAGVVRIIQLVFPQTGPGQWRIYGADW